MSLLPQQILPQSAPVGYLDIDGKSVIIEKGWWLLIYNLCLQILGNQGGTGVSSALQALALTDIEAADSDAIALRRPVSSLEVTAFDESQIPESYLPGIARALLLAQDPLLPDPVPLAQPVKAITPTGSVFSYTLPFNGQVAVTGGIVSAIAIVRQGTSVATGAISGLFMGSRGDIVQVTYSSIPTMSFLPT